MSADVSDLRSYELSLKYGSIEIRIHQFIIHFLLFSWDYVALHNATSSERRSLNLECFVIDVNSFKAQGKAKLYLYEIQLVEEH